MKYMRNNRLWMVVILILVIGCWMTSQTKRYYNRAVSKMETAEIAVKNESYIERLEELDEKMEQMVDVVSDTSNSLKSAAEQERKAWESELQQILEVIAVNLSEEDKTELVREQRIWMKERENTALEASGKKRGNSLKELEYILSYSESTRNRTFELAEQYAFVLAEAD